MEPSLLTSNKSRTPFLVCCLYLYPEVFIPLDCVKKRSVDLCMQQVILSNNGDVPQGMTLGPFLRVMDLREDRIHL